MTQELELVMTDAGEPRIDSRLVATTLGIEHESVMRTFSLYAKELEELGIFRFEIGVKSGPQRGKLPHYAMLNEDQAIFVATLSRNTRQVVDFKLKLTKAFASARHRLQEQEARQNAGAIHTLTDLFRPRVVENLQRVPEGYFSVMGELFKHLYNLEAIINRSLDEHAMIEISVGMRWAKYARENLAVPDADRCKYPHFCQNGRIEQVWASALCHVTTFDQWLWGTYIPQHFPEYVQYRARRVGLPAPRDQLRLAQPSARTSALQLSLSWE